MKPVKMRLLKLSVVGAAIAVSSLAISGCTTVRDNFTSTECEVPKLPRLPNAEPGALSDLDDHDYWALQERERLLVDWAFEMEGMLEVICE